jgi:PhoP regulatory network protein YrbL
MLVLSHLQPLTIGNLRAVYQHPENPALLIKTLRPEAVARRWDAPDKWIKRLPRARQYTGFVRELKEYAAVRARYPNEVAPIARVAGIEDTDVGLGLVNEKVVDAQGDIAPSLHSAYRRSGGAPTWADSALEQLLSDLLRFNVIVGDLHASNVVYGSDSRSPSARLILIDGFGDKNLLPRNTMSRALNQLNTRRVFRRFKEILARPVSTWGPAVRPD